MKSILVSLLFWLSVTTAATADSGAIWIDVRSLAEYEGGHLPGAHNINFDRIGAQISEITTDKNALLMLYCKSGRRSGFAKQTLEQLGYSNVVNAGGINDVLRQARTLPTAGPSP